MKSNQTLFRISPERLRADLIKDEKKEDIDFYNNLLKEIQKEEYRNELNVRKKK